LAHRSFPTRARRAPSLKTWLGQDIPAQVSDLSSLSGTFSPGNKFLGAPFGSDVTILRTRGSVGISMTGPLAATESYSIAVGIGLCTTEAAAAGAVPLPYDNPEWDGWFYYETSAIELYNNATTAAGRASWVIDSKAMRKQPSGQVLFLSTQLFTSSGGANNIVNGVISIRQLVKTS